MRDVSFGLYKWFIYIEAYACIIYIIHASFILQPTQQCTQLVRINKIIYVLVHIQLCRSIDSYNIQLLCNQCCLRNSIFSQILDTINTVTIIIIRTQSCTYLHCGIQAMNVEFTSSLIYYNVNISIPLCDYKEISGYVIGHKLILFIVDGVQ